MLQETVPIETDKTEVQEEVTDLIEADEILDEDWWKEVKNGLYLLDTKDEKEIS